AAPAQRELDVVHGRADGNSCQRQGVADPHRRLFTALDRVADLQAQRREDVALLAVLVVDEGDAGAAVGVVLDRRDLAGDAELVALEVDLPVQLSVAAALVACGDPALVVSSGVRGQRLGERLLGLARRDLVEAGDGHEPSSGAGRLEFSKWHQTLPKSPSIFWPSPSVTMAFFQPAVWPTGPIRRRLRRVLPRMDTVFTSLTLIPWDSYWSSRAFLISVLVADFATLNVYRPCVYSW